MTKATRYTLLLLCLLCAGAQSAQAGDTARVLFIGNSYTAVNNLPQMVQDVAASAGDWVDFDQNAPGSANFQFHTTDAQTLFKIGMGNWDYVVLQDQSQEPAFPTAQVITDVYPYAHQLDTLIHAFSPCAQTIFYMTWGYKNGDASNCASFPPICTYLGMDSLLRLRYGIMADSNKALLSPVGALRRYLRGTAPLIELYQVDESHPTLAGTYAAACAFYSVIFRKSPLAITSAGGQSPADAQTIRNAAKTVVYDSLLYWRVGKYDAKAAFTYSNAAMNVQFANTSVYADSFSWQFGDGGASNQTSPSHTYGAFGTYNVQLIAKHCLRHPDTLNKQITVVSVGVTTQTATGGLLVYVNESGSTMSLVLPAPAAQMQQLSLFSADGKTVWQGMMSKGSEKLDVDVRNLAGGIYFLVIDGPEYGRLRYKVAIGK